MTQPTENTWWGCEIKIDKSQEIKNLGYVARNGKKHIRQYKKEIKNGFSILNLLEQRIEDAKEIMKQNLMRKIEW